MNSLVGYGSSDEEEDDIKPEKPAKIAKTGSVAPPKESNKQPISDATAEQPQIPPPATTTPSAHIAAPTAGPTLAPANAPADSEVDDAPFSPYTYERQRLRELTMPTIPNFDIPDSPPPPERNSEEAAVLAATTKKMERFLELKKQGVHFNERLQNTNSLRNPSLLPKLMEFADIGKEESYRSSLPEEMDVPVRWPEECYVEGLLKANERKEKKRVEARDKLDFVPAGAGSGGERRKSKFHR